MTDGHTLLQGGMLVQIARADIFCPLDFSLVRCQAARDDIHKGRFSFSICPDKTDVLAFEKAK